MNLINPTKIQKPSFSFLSLVFPQWLPRQLHRLGYLHLLELFLFLAKMNLDIIIILFRKQYIRYMSMFEINQKKISPNDF